MELNLNHGPWKLQGWWPGVPLWMENISGIMGNRFQGVTEPIDATVPGGVHHDLWKAGIIDDPYKNRNSMLCEWVENRWWMYSTAFTVPDEYNGKKLSLVFNGIDYHAHFYINDTKLGEHIGQFDEAIFDVTGSIIHGRENTLNVLFESVPDETGQIGFTSRTWTQKSRFAYKWDWSTRLVNIGIWDDVILRATGKAAIGDVHVTTTCKNGIGILGLGMEISGNDDSRCTAEIQVRYNDRIISSSEKSTDIAGGAGFLDETVRIPKPELWYPNGSGNQPLYTFKATLKCDGMLSDEREYTVGIRKLRFIQNTDSDPDSLPYTIVINDVPVYAKSVNLSPWDQMYGNVTPEIYERNVLLLKKANINLVRINGCGVIEKKVFYSLCDKHGIMIWQDFIQSSSGIDNVPSVIPEFLNLLKKTAISVVKKRRNHVSTTIWCGGNELMDETSLTTGTYKPVTSAHPNIAMLKEIVAVHDPDRLFLPSSASGPNFGLNTDTPGKNHDVHGPHTYLGVSEHYRVYNENDCLFHGELGSNGMAGIISLRKFLSPEDLRVTTMQENIHWRHHGEWWDSKRRDEDIFGEITDLGRFVKASQFIQAEGLRYALEANRRRKFRNSGSSIWAFNEAFPNVSNCAFVDYYGVPKMAYYWVGSAFAPLHCSLRYDKLFFSQSEQVSAQIYLHNSLRKQEVTIAWELLDTGGTVYHSGMCDLTAEENSVVHAGDIRVKLPAMAAGIFFIRLRLRDSRGNRIVSNLYVFSQREKAIFAPLFELAGGALSVSENGSTFEINNTGNEVCLFVHGVETRGDSSVYIDNNYTSVFPGETERFTTRPVYVPRGTAHGDLKYIWDYFNNPKAATI